MSANVHLVLKSVINSSLLGVLDPNGYLPDLDPDLKKTDTDSQPTKDLQPLILALDPVGSLHLDAGRGFVGRVEDVDETEQDSDKQPHPPSHHLHNVC